ncbi:hypothetical protein ACWCOT_29700 [Nonomuraea bangladeshensis]
MAAIVYFSKVHEDSLSVRYVFGADSAAMTSTLVVDKEECRARPEEGAVDYHFLKASRKIISLFDETNEWPARGMSVS